MIRFAFTSYQHRASSSKKKSNALHLKRISLDFSLFLGSNLSNNYTTFPFSSVVCLKNTHTHTLFLLIIVIRAKCAVFVSSSCSIKSKQWKISHPVKVRLSVINHQINSERSRANTEEGFKYPIQPQSETQRR